VRSPSEGAAGAEPEETASRHGLHDQILRGLSWSMLSSIALRAASFATGVVLARLLTPDQFGVYAVALTVQAILITMADLGLSAELIRCSDPVRRAPAVGLIGLATGSVLTVVMVVTAPAMSRVLGAPEASSVIALLAVTVLLAGAGVVPYAMLQRRFDQRTLFLIAAVDFAVSTAVTIGLLVAGRGVISLAIGRVAGQTSTLVLQYLCSGVRPSVRTDRATLVSTLRFCLPVGGANLLSWVLLNLDNVVIARAAGPVALGFYVLAFNISNWPMSVVGQVVRSIALPAFSRMPGTAAPDPATGRRSPDVTLGRAVGFVAAVALPVGALLCLLATPVVSLVYGERWLPAAPVLVALGAFGAVRILFDLMAGYLLARGRAAATLIIQAVWCVTLIPALQIATHRHGIVGAGWAHVIVAAVVIVPAYLIAVSRAGAALGPVLRGLLLPALGTAVLIAAVAGTVLLIKAADLGSAQMVVLGGLAGAGAYAAVVGRWFVRILREARAVGSAPPVHLPVGVS
jgi:lipopolysaccharide exporter